MTTIVCQHCQAKNEAGTELCVACGQPLEAPGDKGHTGPVEREEVEQWVRQLPEFGKLDAESLAHDDESLPAWLQAVRAHADKMTDQEAGELLDFLADLDAGEPDKKSKPPAEEAPARAKSTVDLPDWVAALMPEETWPEAEEDAQIAEHFAGVEEEDDETLPSTAPLPSTRPLPGTSELKGIPELLAGEELPEWLADQKAEEKRPDTEEPPGWPGRSKRLRAASPGVAAHEPAAREPAATEPPPAAEPEPEPGLETIDSVLDEIEAAAVEAREQPAGSTDELSGFSDWMDPAQAAALEETLEEMLDLPDADTSEGRVDQWLDILEGLPGGRETAQPDQPVSDAELEAAEIPDWMQSLRPEKAAGEAVLADLGPPEESGPLAGLRGVIPAAAISLGGVVDRSATRLEMSKEQRQQAALLRRLAAAEPEVGAVADSPRRDRFLVARVVLGAALLLVIFLGLALPDVADLLPQPGDQELPPAAARAREVVAASAGQTALVAFDYTPSMAGELDAVAGVLLADLAANDISVLTLTQIAAGVPMADRATAAIEDLNGSSIGYLPGEASGLRALGDCLGQNCDAVAGKRLGPEARAALAQANLILVLTADRDSLAGWIEQVGTQSDISIVGGVTQAMGPVAMPYVQSGQLAGLVEGLPVSVVYAETAGQAETAGTELLSGLTLAQWLAIAVLVAGAVYFGFAAPAASAVSQVAKK